MKKYDGVERDSFNLQTFVDIKIVATALLVCDEQGIEIHGASELGRQCIAAIASTSVIPVSSVQTALDILSSHGFSMEQFKVRGDAIRKTLAYEDTARLSPEQEKRASEIALVIEGLSDKNGVFVQSEADSTGESES